MMTSTTDRYSITGKSILGLARSYLECFSHCTCNNSMQYSPSDAESRAIFPPLPPIFNGILSWEAQPRVTKYRWISGNITRGEAECNISRYWMRESSRMKYPTHPEGRLRPLAAPAQHSWHGVKTGVINSWVQRDGGKCSEVGLWYRLHMWYCRHTFLTEWTNQKPPFVICKKQDGGTTHV